MVYHMATRVMIDNVKVYCLVEVAHGGSLYKSSGIVDYTPISLKVWWH